MTGWMSAPDDLPRAPGAYALRLVFVTPTPLPPRFGGLLAAGTYVYCGSARGGGGLQARCARHLAVDKTRRWHVDWLSTTAAERAVWAVLGGDECALRAALSAAGAAVPVPGFGSSDCPACPSHLLLCPDGLDITAALRHAHNAR